MKLTHWRAVVAALPLPMLALAASYGVFSFALLFVPLWVAIVQAAAFELTYIGLAVVKVEDAQRRRARAISVGAVVVSIGYNTLAGLFHRMPDMLTSMPLWAEAVLAVLHGAPLAWVAFLVADLLLHQQHEPAPALVPDLTLARDGAIPGPVFHAAPVRAEPMQADAGLESIAPHSCPKCGAALDRPRYLAARRWGHCAACK